MTPDSELRRRYVLALDEVLPPAPALQASVNEALRAEQRSRTRRRTAPMFFGSGLRLTAGVAALIVGIIAASALVMSGRVFVSPATSHAPQSYRFLPTYATPAADWPQGGPVPSSLAGCWQLQTRLSDGRYELCLGQYSFDLGQGWSVGNVVVQGGEIEFFRSDICALNSSRPANSYRYSLAGGKLTLINLDKLVPGGTGAANNDSSCGWELDGTYFKLASQ